MPKKIKTVIKNISGSNKNNNNFGSQGTEKVTAERRKLTVFWFVLLSSFDKVSFERVTK